MCSNLSINVSYGVNDVVLFSKYSKHLYLYVYILSLQFKKITHTYIGVPSCCFFGGVCVLCWTPVSMCPSVI